MANDKFLRSLIVLIILSACAGLAIGTVDALTSGDYGMSNGFGHSKQDHDMNVGTMGNLSGFDPGVRAFLDKINAQPGPPIYKMSPADARKVLDDLQNSTAVSMMPADIMEIDIPGGPTGPVHAHIVRPQGHTEPLPVTMYYHGGGWVLGNFGTHERLVRELANKAGTAIVFVDYTPSPEAQYPVILEQGYRALEYIAANGSQYNLDSSRLALAGDSVGGNMVAVLTAMAKERNGPNLRYQALLYSVTGADFDTGSYREFANGYWLTRDAMIWFWDNYLPDKQARNQASASPLLMSTDQLKGQPPALVITDEHDVLRDEGEAYAHKLIDAGVSTTAVRILGTVHDFMMLNALADTPPTRAAIDLTSDKLREALAK
jgi:Esterase/lipase